MTELDAGVLNVVVVDPKSGKVVISVSADTNEMAEKAAQDLYKSFADHNIRYQHKSSEGFPHYGQIRWLHLSTQAAG